MAYSVTAVGLEVDRSRVNNRMMFICTFYFQLDPPHERKDEPPLSPAQLMHWSPSISPSIMSHMHLGSFFRGRALSNTARAERIPTNLTSVVFETASPVVPWVIYSKGTVSSWLTRHYVRLAFTTSLANTVHLHATHAILVLRVDVFIIFINLSNQTRVLPPGPD